MKKWLNLVFVLSLVTWLCQKINSNWMILWCGSVDVDASSRCSSSNIWPWCDLDLDLVCDCDTSSRLGDMGSQNFFTSDLAVTLTLAPWPSKSIQFMFGHEYTDNQSLVKFRPLVFKIVRTGPKSTFSSMFDSLWPWTLTFWPQKLMYSCARLHPCLKWWKYVQHFSGYCLTFGTHRQTHRHERTVRKHSASGPYVGRGIKVYKGALCYFFISVYSRVSFVFSCCWY